MVNIPQMRTMVLEYIMNIVWDIIGYIDTYIYINLCKLAGDGTMMENHGYNVRPPATIAFSWCK